MLCCKTADVMYNGKDAILEELTLTSDEACKALEYIRQMDANRLPYKTTHGLLVDIAQSQTWIIYFHFTDWKVPVTASLIDGLKQNFQSCMQSWLMHLKGYHGFPNTEIKLGIFGFVFQKGITIDDSFYESYGMYPRVTEWTRDDESSPWALSYNQKPYTGSFYASFLKLSHLKVTGNTSVPG